MIHVSFLFSTVQGTVLNERRFLLRNLRDGTAGWAFTASDRHEVIGVFLSYLCGISCVFAFYILSWLPKFLSFLGDFFFIFFWPDIGFGV